MLACSDLDLCCHEPKSRAIFDAYFDAGAVGHSCCNTPAVLTTPAGTCPSHLMQFVTSSQCEHLRSKGSGVLQMSSGLGQSKSAEAPAAVGELAPAGFLKEVCEQLSLSPAVVISPSLSGMYSLPFLHQHQALVRAYIPVAPICTDKFTAEQYQSVKVQFYKPLLYIPL